MGTFEAHRHRRSPYFVSPASQWESILQIGSNDKCDRTVDHTLLMELQAIQERATLARRFHQLMGQCLQIEIPVQYERLYLRSLAGRGEPTHDHPRGH